MYPPAPFSCVSRASRSLIVLGTLAVLLGVPFHTRAQETDQDMPVNAVGGAVHVDQFTGTATTSIPIEVPPGRGGIQPDLALVYNSANGNGWVGMGWKLEKGVIERQTKFGVDYTGDDYIFRLSGVNVELVPSNYLPRHRRIINIDRSTLYQAKVEGGFMRVQKQTAPDGKPFFVATDKAGTKFFFGTHAGSRVADPGDATKIFRWCLDEVRDVNGNVMFIDYTGDQGQGYLSHIVYNYWYDEGNRRRVPTTSVIFHLEDRPDAVPMYTSNFLMKTAKRLKTIEVRANGKLVRAYKLSYDDTSSSTTRSLLRSVQQFGKDANIDGTGTVTDGTSSPSTTLSYLTTVPPFSYRGTDRLIPDHLGHSNGTQRVYIGDFNGDGQADVLRSGDAMGANTLYISQRRRYLTSPTSFKAYSRVVPGHLGHSNGTKRVYIGDFNGDGKADLLRAGDASGDNKLHISHGTSFKIYYRVILDHLGHSNGTQRVYIGDFNGDGKADVLRAGDASGDNMLYISHGTGFTAYSRVIPDHLGHSNGTQRVYIGDFNGDGKADVLRAGDASGDNTLYISHGTRFTAYSRVIPDHLGHSNGTQRVYIGDFNGDGKADVLRASNSPGAVLPRSKILSLFNLAKTRTNFAWWFEFLTYQDRIRSGDVPGANTLYLSHGTSFKAYPGVISDHLGHSNRTQRVYIGDFNGDGKADVLRSGDDSGDNTLHISHGTSFKAYPPWGSNYPEVGVIPDHLGHSNRTQRAYIGDFNGDGRADVLRSGNASGDNTLYETAKFGEGHHLLRGLSNGLGATTTIVYTPSTLYPNTQLPYPVQTVSKITTDDGKGHVAATTYQYSGGYHHIGEREFRGFNRVKVTGPAGPSGEQTITETWFHQGNDTAVDVNDPAGADGYLKGAPYRMRVTDGAGKLYTETTTTYTADTDGLPPFFTPPASVVTRICDGTACTKTTRTDFRYNPYGGVIREYQYGDTGTSADDRTVVRGFHHNLRDWIVGMPVGELLYEGLGREGRLLARTDFYYDGTTSCAVASTNRVPTRGQLTRTVRWQAGATSHPETRLAYDAKGNISCTRDARGHVTTMSYDRSDTFVTTVTNPKGQVTTTQYYGVNGVATDHGLYGQVKSVTDPNGAVVSTQYDALGRRTRVTRPDGFWTTTHYVGLGSAGQHVRTDSRLGLSTWKYFDGLGRVFQTVSTGPDAKKVVTRTEYDVRGAVTRTSVPVWTTASATSSTTTGPAWLSPVAESQLRWTTYTYDVMGRGTRVTHPDGTRALSCYDDWVSVTIDANNHRTRTTRDAYGRVQTVQEYAGTYTTCDTAVGTPYATTGYAYDRLGNLVTVTDALGNRTTMTYDTLSRKTAMRDPDLGSWTYAYDPNGNLLRQTDARGQQIHFQYDTLDRRVQKDYGTRKVVGTGDVVYTYDGATGYRQGRLAGVRDASGTASFVYDRMGQVIRTDKVVDAVTYTTRTTYDGLGRVTSLTYPDASRVTYTYNGPQLQSVQEGATTYARYRGFTALGQPGTLTLGNGVTTTYTYGAQTLRLKTLKTVRGAAVLQDLGYTFDAGGNVTAITDPRHGSQTFRYDALDRLTRATRGAAAISYRYNHIGNLLSKTGAGTYQYNASGARSIRPHAVTAVGSRTYRYDANGNLLEGGGRVLTYDAENRPASIVKDGVTTKYVYDGDGGRVKKTVGERTTVYIGKLYVCTGTSCAKMIYAGGQRVAIVQVPPPGGTASTGYIHPDHLGSASVVTDAAGRVSEHNSYRPYGALATHTGRTDVAYKYTGQERDASTGLYFYQARYYDPVLGRFLTPDHFVQSSLDPQTLNRYAYARNNPVKYTDPSGNFFGIAFLIGAVVGGISSGIASDWDLGATFTGAAIGGFSAGVGAGVGGFVGKAVGGGYGALAGSVAGGLAGGAVAGGTRAVLYRAAGYNTNIGLAIAAGAGGGLAGGLVGFGVGDVVGNTNVGYAAGAAGGGAVSSTISGGDPGVGALYAVVGAGLAMGGNALIEGGTQSITKYIKNKTAQAAVELTIDLVGKVWTLPNTAVGLVYGGTGHVVGLFLGMNPGVKFSHNGIHFSNNPFILESHGLAVTLGNVSVYKPGAMDANITHETGHTYQYQILGPFFLSAYGLEALLGGGIRADSGNNFEVAARKFASGGGWWP